MELYFSLHNQLGVMTIPLTVLSLIALMLLIERCVYLAFNSRTSSQQLIGQLCKIDINDQPSLEAFAIQNLNKKHTLSQGVGLLLTHRQFDKPLREETVGIWLTKKKQHYHSGLRFLSIIGVISPLIGLLGTVLGLIEMFKDLSLTSGSISPSDLAHGLGLAMSTTAAGLIIAVPSIFGSQILQIWADRSLEKYEHVLNHCNLYLEGISPEISQKARSNDHTHQSSSYVNTSLLNEERVQP